MLVGIKNVSKLIGISIIACCAVLVCTMFLNFYFDIRLIESEITSELVKTLVALEIHLKNGKKLPNSMDEIC